MEKTKANALEMAKKEDAKRKTKKTEKIVP